MARRLFLSKVCDIKHWWPQLTRQQKKGIPLVINVHVDLSAGILGGSVTAKQPGSVSAGMHAEWSGDLTANIGKQSSLVPLNNGPEFDEFINAQVGKDYEVEVELGVDLSTTVKLYEFFGATLDVIPYLDFATACGPWYEAGYGVSASLLLTMGLSTNITVDMPANCQNHKICTFAWNAALNELNDLLSKALTLSAGPFDFDTATSVPTPAPSCPTDYFNSNYSATSPMPPGSSPGASPGLETTQSPVVHPTTKSPSPLALVTCYGTAFGGCTQSCGVNEVCCASCTWCISCCGLPGCS